LKIVLISPNFYPEDTAIGLYNTELVDFLSKNGHQLSVVTGFPYYPQWKIWEEFKNKNNFLKENINGVKVYRFKQYVPSDPTFFKRIMHLISFTLGSFINLFKLSKPDLVIGIIPFTSSAFLGWLLKLRYSSKLWIHVQDFEFDAALESGLLGSGSKTLINMLMFIENKILNKADITSTISFGMMNKLQNKTRSKQYYLPNWIDASLFSSNLTHTHKYFTKDKFNILYSGNIGKKQDWDFFLEFSDKLSSFSEIEVILVGEGAEKEKITQKLINYKNVKHFNLVPIDDLPSLLFSADLHILFQKHDIIDTVMPSKLLGMMASGKPLLVSGNSNSEIAKIFNESNVGFFFGNNSINDVIDCVYKLKNNELLYNELGENAKNYVTANFSKKTVLNKLLEEIEFYKK